MLRLRSLPHHRNRIKNQNLETEIQSLNIQLLNQSWVTKWLPKWQWSNLPEKPTSKISLTADGRGTGTIGNGKKMPKKRWAAALVLSSHPSLKFLTLMKPPLMWTNHIWLIIIQWTLICLLSLIMLSSANKNSTYACQMIKFNLACTN